MSEHRATVRWEQQGHDFSYESYSRDHIWLFDGGISVRTSAAAEFRGNPELVDPEQAFVAALSSCHMLTFLAIAARKRITVERYEDRAVGYLEKDARGRLAVTRVLLEPRITFGDDRQLADEELAEMHAQAHRACFLANSVKTEIVVSAAAERSAQGG